MKFCMYIYIYKFRKRHLYTHYIQTITNVVMMRLLNFISDQFKVLEACKGKTVPVL